jgi:excisionase family DNA binding protein
MLKLPEKELLRVEEVAEYLGVSKSTVYLYIDNGILPDVEKYSPGVIRIPRESVLKCRLAKKLKPLE